MWHFLSILLAVAPVLAGVQELWWNITFVENANPDGLQERRVIGVNNSWPIPPIDVNSTDDLLVHVINSLDSPSTLHHHGMFFNASSWMDGALGVSECGTAINGGTFDYVVPISTSGQWGTYWVHSHAAGQYVDGLKGSVVIHPPNETHSYDEEYTIILSDWYHDQHDTLLAQFINIANPGGAEPVPDSSLIFFAQNATYLPPISGTTSASPGVGFNENSTLPFEAGKTYRLRIVNTSAFAMFYFWIDGHDMRIIEVDGTDVEEAPVDLISATVAQRYSVLVTARNDSSPSNWAIHANMDTTMFDTVPDTLNPNLTSSITYSSSASLTDYDTIDVYADVNDTALVPIVPFSPPPSDMTLTLLVSFDTMDDGTNHAMFNGVTYNTPNVPAIFTAISMGDNATLQSIYTPQTFVIDHLQVVDIVVQNGDAGKHPFHLHGHKFAIMGRSEDYTSDDPALNPPIVEGQANPIYRDTVEVPSGSSATLRFIADNPGAWFFHCHIEWHLEVGLAIVLVEAPLLVQENNNVPQSMYDNCAADGMLFTGNAAGHNSTTDLSGLPLGPYQQNLGWHSRGIGAMAGCVLTAVLGMLTVVWYSLTGVHVSDEEMEHEVRQQIEAKARKGRLFGLIKPGKA